MWSCILFSMVPSTGKRKLCFIASENKMKETNRNKTIKTDPYGSK